MNFFVFKGLARICCIVVIKISINSHHIYVLVLLDMALQFVVTFCFFKIYKMNDSRPHLTSVNISIFFKKYIQFFTTIHSDSIIYWDSNIDKRNKMNAFIDQQSVKLFRWMCNFVDSKDHFSIHIFKIWPYSIKWYVMLSIFSEDWLNLA